MASNISRRKILIIGRRGNGKSSLGNLLLEGVKWKHKFQISELAHSVSTFVGLNTSSILDIDIHDTTGFDDTVSRAQIVGEIQSIVTNITSLDGILFVLKFGRCDDWDKAVFVTYLQLILSGVPNGMIGLVFTNSNDNYVSHNDVEEYLSKHGTGIEQTNFLEMVMQRCNRKACFINNPDPSADKLTNYDLVRTKSLENLSLLINELNGAFSFAGILDTIKNAALYWTIYARENPLKLSLSVIIFVGAIMAAFAKK